MFISLWIFGMSYVFWNWWFWWNMEEALNWKIIEHSCWLQSPPFQQHQGPFPLIIYIQSRLSRVALQSGLCTHSCFTSPKYPPNYPNIHKYVIPQISPQLSPNIPTNTQISTNVHNYFTLKMESKASQFHSLRLSLIFGNINTESTNYYG